MACTLKYKEAIQNAKDTFVKNDIINEDNSINSLVKYERYINDYRDSLVKYFPEINTLGEIATIEDNKIVFNTEVFDFIDNKRKEFGIYESRLSTYDYFTTNNSQLETLEDSSKKEQLNWFEEDNQSFSNDEDINYSDQNNYILLGNKQGKITVDEVLNNILSNYNGLSDNSKVLLEKAANLVGKSGAKIQFVNASVFLFDDTIMDWESNTNTIRLSRDIMSLYSPEILIETFLHEVAHSQSGQALLNPTTFEQREFKSLIEEAYNKFKYLATPDSTGELSYGFTNPMEFVAELYSNQTFQNEIRNLDKGFWNNFINALRRLFGLTKNTSYNNLLDQIVKVVEVDQTNFRGTQGQSLVFESRQRLPKTKIETTEDRLNRTLNKAKDNLDQLLKRAKTYKKANPEKGVKFQQHIQELISQIEKVDKVNQWKGIAVYVKSMNSTVTQLNQRIDNEDFSKGNGLEIIELYKSYLSSYDLIDDVKKLVTSLESEQIDEIGREDIETIENDITEASGKHSLLESKFNSKLVKVLRNELSDIKYTPQVTTDWRNRLSKEYKVRGINNISANEWIANQMNTIYKDEIDEDINKYINNLLDGIGNDISTAAVNFLDGINNNSRLVQITMQLFTEARNRIIERTKQSDFELKELFDKLIQEKGKNTKLSKLYENILDYDSNKKAYLKGEYSIKFKEEWNKFKANRDSILESKGKNSTEYKEANSKYRKWISDNTTVVDFQMKPIDKWKNNLDNISQTEKDIINKFQNILQTTNNETLGRNSLIESFKGIKYYNLPSVTNSYLERITEGNVKGVFKDIKEDLTKIRPDDIGYEERRLDSKGDPVNFLKVHYRGELSPEQQSLDLFTIMRLERINGINFSEKQNIQLTVEAIKNVAKNKEYFLKQKGSNIPIYNLFATREKEATFPGSQSNEYKMLSNLIEKNLYDIFHVNYGTIAGADVNKVISTANAWTASIGLSLNRFSAAANLLNGQSQIFLEKVAGNHLSKGAIRKAHKIYNSDLGNIMSDYGKPIKESFVNQINQMFDTFGGFTVKQQEFIRNSIAKTTADFGSLQFMQEGGEHYLQSIMVMATLDSIKVMNDSNQYIDKEGKVTSQDKAASILDMLSRNKDTKILELDKSVVYSDKNFTTKMDEGGKAQILLFVKKKLFDTMGNYDSNLQPEAYRHWWGKMLLMFRRYLIPQAYNRYRGITTAFRKYDELDEDSTYYSASLQDYEEGYYVSAIRFLRNGVIPALKKLKFDILRQNWNELTDTQKANIRKTTVEISITMAILPLIGMLAAAGADDDKDQEWLYTVAFLSRRLESELAQFRDPREATKITKSPIPSLRIIEETMDIIESTLTPWNWDERYQSGKRKGDLKIVRSYEKLVPVLSRIDTTSEELYNGLNSTFGK